MENHLEESLNSLELSGEVVSSRIEETKNALEKVSSLLNETLSKLTPQSIRQILRYNTNLYILLDNLYQKQAAVSSNIQQLNMQYQERYSVIKNDINKIEHLKKSLYLLKIISRCKKIIRQFQQIKNCDKSVHDIQNLIQILNQIENYLSYKDYKDIEELETDRLELINVKEGIIDIFRSLFSKKLYQENSTLSEIAYILIANKSFEKDLLDILDSELKTINIFNIFSHDKTNWESSSKSIDKYLKFVLRIQDLEQIIIKSSSSYFTSTRNELYSTYLWRKLVQTFKTLVQRSTTSMTISAKRNIEVNYLIILGYLYEIENYYFIYIKSTRDVKGALVDIFSQTFEKNYLNYLSSQLNSYITQNCLKNSVDMSSTTSLDALLRNLQRELALAFKLNIQLFESIIKRFCEFVEVLCDRLEKIKSHGHQSTNPETGTNSYKITISCMYTVIIYIFRFINKNIMGDMINDQKILNMKLDSLKLVEEVKFLMETTIIEPIKKLIDLPLKMLLPDYSQSSRVNVAKLNVSYVIADIRNNLTHWSKEHSVLIQSSENLQLGILQEFVDKLFYNLLKSCFLSKITSKIHANNLLNDVKGLLQIYEKYELINLYINDGNFIIKLLNSFPNDLILCLEDVKDFSLKIDRYYILYFIAVNLQSNIDLIQGFYTNIHELYYWLDGKASVLEKNEVILNLIVENTNISEEIKAQLSHLLK